MISLDFSNSKYFNLVVPSEKDAQSFNLNDKGWSYSYVYSMRELKDVYLLLKTIKDKSLINITEKCIDIIIPENKLHGAKIGQKVFVTITDWTDAKIAPIGVVIKVLGKPMENNVEMEAIALEKGFDSVFPIAVLKEAEKIANDGIKNKDMENRRDMRNTTTFTVDPEDAKDFDDALSFKKLANSHFEIGVHIADVSHYVKLHTALDKEARTRGTSVYLVDRTISMLPEELSNDLCTYF